jgi:outer membrane protein OmpA-like peptidoglycan-associated protein
MKWNRIFSCSALFIFFLISSLTAQTNEFLAKQADGYFQNKQFFKAALIYQQLQKSLPQDEDLLVRRVIAEYETNNLDTAATLCLYGLSHNIRKGNVLKYVYGKIMMSRGKFAEAATYFKQSLSSTPQSSDLHKKLIEEIKHCGSGDALTVQSSQVLVEPAGSEVNTIWNEINPIPSINSDSRIYFNSNRESVGAMSNYGIDFELPYDMYASNLTNGEWSDIGPLNADLNTKSHEMLADFDERGQVVYYKRGDRLDALGFITDTFDQHGIKRIGVLPISFIGPNDEIFFFNDSMLLFSSNRAGGFGGSDLYYALKKQGRWKDPVNLGKTINTAYDEVSPFLAFDGRTLIFSSNNPLSMGGYDLFSSYFDDRSRSWTTPVNLGTPLNSSEDDRYFRLNKNRLSALFASNRKTGIGGYDIYFAYFNQAWAPQTERSKPVFFGEVNDEWRNTASSSSVTSVSSDLPREIVHIEPPIIYYESDDQLSLPSITRKLDEIAEILQKKPDLNTIIEVFADHSGDLGQSLLFSIRRAELLKEYLKNHGARSSQLYIKGYGFNFPVAAESLNGQPNPSGKSLNKRIEFSFFQADPGIENKYSITKENIPVNIIFKSGEYDLFRAGEKKLNYKILLLSTSNPANLESYIKNENSSFFIEKNNITGKYDLMTGAKGEYADANVLRKDWRSKGFDDAAVIAYIENARISPSGMSRWAAIYPDLINYINRSE